jgi:hypothetical protein
MIFNGREFVMRSALIGIVLATFLAMPTPCGAEAAKALTNADVVQMVKAGLPESTIVLSIQSSPAEFQTAPTDLIALKKAGVGQAVLDAMVTKGASTGPSSVVAYGATAAVVPGGFVAIDGDRRVGLQLSSPDANKPKRKFWHSEYVGIFAGSRADVRLSSRTPTFELPFPPGPDAEKAVRLMKMDVRGDTREVSLRVLAYDAMLRRVPTVTDGVIETTLTAVPGAAPDAVGDASLLSPASALEPGEYAIIRSNTDVYDFGID